jgi:hypothetical protein
MVRLAPARFFVKSPGFGWHTRSACVGKECHAFVRCYELLNTENAEPSKHLLTTGKESPTLD